MKPTASEDQTLVEKASAWKKTLWVSVVGIILPPALGFGSSAFNMMQAFQKVSATGTGDSAALAENVSTSLRLTAIGLLVSLAFVVLLILSLVMLNRLKRKHAKASQG